MTWSVTDLHHTHTLSFSCDCFSVDGITYFSKISEVMKQQLRRWFYLLPKNRHTKISHRNTTHKKIHELNYELLHCRMLNTNGQFLSILASSLQSGFPLTHTHTHKEVKPFANLRYSGFLILQCLCVCVREKHFRWSTQEVESSVAPLFTHWIKNQSPLELLVCLELSRISLTVL